MAENTFCNLTHKTMQQKRINTIVGAITALCISATVLLSACGNRGNWSQREREMAREMLQEWREWVYLNELSEEEFALFASNVTDLLEEQYPSFVEFIEMPMVGDSVEMVMIAAIVTDIKASPERLRHIFSYKELTDSQILPTGLNKSQQAAFYKCFAEKVNIVYGSMQQFVWDALNSSLDDALIAQMMRHCAEPFWEVGN